MDFTISSTGFVNYFPSAERTQRKLDEAFEKHGKDIAIINGEDDWHASNVFHISFLLDKFKIEKIDNFHTGISGISHSGAIIAKSDLSKFIKMFNRMKWKIYRENRKANLGSIRIYDNDERVWRTFFSLEWRMNDRHEIHNPVNNFKVKKKTFMWPL